MKDKYEENWKDGNEKRKKNFFDKTNYILKKKGRIYNR